MNALVSAWIQQPFSKDRGTQHITGTVSNEATSDMDWYGILDPINPAYLFPDMAKG